MAELRRTEAKAFFANERTFLHWMNMSVTVGSISAALVGISGHAHKNWGQGYETGSIFVRGIALAMMGIAILMTLYAAHNFRLRGEMLMLKMDGPYDNRILPITISALMIVFLSIVFVGAVVRYVDDSKS
ncbi:hypothetical protein WJX73_001059 [Symbiochloris irregularis]|uniref:DUF202 domain-containing protein n=1 Tax=Symbiochloris irregularis TaxID=706552 RepID=A0AAW1P0H7_9CHLO